MDQALFELETYGFTLLADVLAPSEVAALRATGERLLASRGEDLVFHGRAGHVANLPTLDPIYFPLIDHPRVLPLLEAVMGPELILGSLNTRIIRPGETEQGWHGDIPDQLQRLGPPVMMNTLWMLDDVSPANGSTRIVPGSHRTLRRHPPEGVEVKFVHQLTAPAGSVLVINGQCWHAGGANTTDRNRHVLFGHYRVATWMRFQADPHRNFPPAWFDRLNERQKRLMRMHKGLGHPTSSEYDEV
jgi:ectoine hydroxylase-related dioxygenase (phytanoyl-CoA dioxygenase family)